MQVCVCCEFRGGRVGLSHQRHVRRSDKCRDRDSGGRSLLDQCRALREICIRGEYNLRQRLGVPHPYRHRRPHRARFGKFAYAANSGSDNVSIYSINDATGILTHVGTIVTGHFPASVSIDPSGRFAYVGFSSVILGDPGAVAAYTINAVTGLLTEVAGSPEVAGNGPSSFAIGPSGEFAYVTNFYSTSVWVYSIYPTNTSAGRLTPIDIVPGDFSMYLPRSITVDPSGKYAYVAVNAGVLAYSLDATTGAMSNIGTFAAGTGPVFITTTGRIH